MLIIGHRGASAYSPENTIKAFKLAFEQGADGIECDIIQVRGKSVIIHDDRLERTTSGEGYVAEASDEQFATLDAGDGERIPNLTDIFECLPEGAWCNLELKRITNTALWAEELKALLQRYPHLQDRLLISSFNHTWLAELAQYFPAIKFAYLIAHYPADAKAFARSISSFAINVDLSVIDKVLVKTIQDQGKQVWVFTVDHQQDIEKCLAMGVDGIFTNVPDKALSICRS